jgi:hypothetical protein
VRDVRDEGCSEDGVRGDFRRNHLSLRNRDVVSLGSEIKVVCGNACQELVKG